MNAETKDQVWLELPAPVDAAHAKEICAKANRMMARIGDTAGYEFSWDSTDSMFWWSGPMGGAALPKRGIWFRLDYLGREGA